MHVLVDFLVIVQTARLEKEVRMFLQKLWTAPHRSVEGHFGNCSWEWSRQHILGSCLQCDHIKLIEGGIEAVACITWESGGAVSIPPQPAVLSECLAAPWSKMSGSHHSGFSRAGGSWSTRASHSRSVGLSPAVPLQGPRHKSKACEDHLAKPVSPKGKVTWLWPCNWHWKRKATPRD